MMLHKRYPEASRRCTEIVRQEMAKRFGTVEAFSAARGAFVAAEAILEHEGLVKTSGARFSEREIAMLLNWGKP